MTKLLGQWQWWKTHADDNDEKNYYANDNDESDNDDNRRLRCENENRSYWQELRFVEFKLIISMISVFMIIIYNRNSNVNLML